MTEKLNGFDLGVISTLQGCIREDPERAHPLYGTTVRGRVDSGFESIEIDVRLDADADPEMLQGLAAEVLRMSIIPDTIARPVPIAMHLR